MCMILYELIMLEIFTLRSSFVEFFVCFWGILITFMHTLKEGYTVKGCLGI